MNTYSAKAKDVKREYFIANADGKVLGRLASRIAAILAGKHKPIYTTHVDTGDFVIVLNADKIKVTGKKAQLNVYDYYTRHPSGHKFVTFAEMMAKKPEKVVELAVRRMLPKSIMGKDMLKKLKIYRGPEHDHHAQKPQKLELFPQNL